MLTIVFVVGLFPLSFFDIRLLITSLISSISSHHFCIPAPPWTVFQSNLKYDCLPTHATGISINYILYICPWSTLSSTSARACTCSGEWGSAACTHGNPSKLRITLITPITNKSQWYAVPFFILKEKSTCYYNDKQYLLQLTKHNWSSLICYKFTDKITMNDMPMQKSITMLRYWWFVHFPLIFTRDDYYYRATSVILIWYRDINMISLFYKMTL